MRGQSEVVGTIVLLALLLASVAVSYTWGMPLINKNSDANRIVYIRQLFAQLAQDLSTVAREGGQKTLNIQTDKGDLKFEIDPTGDYILGFSMLTDMRFFSESEVPLDDASSPYVVKEAFLNATGEGCSLYDGSSGCSYYRDFYSCSQGKFSSSSALPTYLAGLACLCKAERGQQHDRLVLKEDDICTEYIIDASIADTGYTMTNAAASCEVESCLEYYATINGGYDTATGVLGSDKPGVVLAQSIPFGRTYETHLKLKPRKILDPSSNEIVVIKLKPAEGSSISAKGSFSFTVRESSESVSFSGTTKVRTITLEASMK